MTSVLRTITGLGLMLLIITGCISENAGDETTVAEEPVIINTGIQLDKRLERIDSLVVFFYKDPFGPDAANYTRYYKFYTTSSDTAIGLLHQNLGSHFKEDTLRDCRSEGKIYAYNRGKVQQTIYFTFQSNRCNHLYFVNTGRYYYFLPDAALVAWLKSIKPLAKEA